MQEEAKPPADASEVAEQLAKELNERGIEYALRGAIALSYWAEPRGTMDVDLTLFVSIDKPSEVVWLLSEIGCEIAATTAIASIQACGFCQAKFGSFRVNVFVPTIAFYERAKARRRYMRLGDQHAMIWDADIIRLQNDVLPSQGHCGR